MKILSAAERAFLEEPFVGVVTTLGTDGAPQSTVVWIDVDDEGVSINTAYGRVKPRNLARDPRISLVVVDPGDPHRWLKVRGTASLVDEGADAQIDRLSKKYTGRDVYASRAPGERRVSVRIEAERIDSHGLDSSTRRGQDASMVSRPMRGSPA
ncbi:MAG: PPOX class F420-dependent oxidoreductase, partial [Actinomycetota bacterium]|nr:PPOX class F420-dependent oxidoreductase [Actinomycetota bacterium]